MHRITCFLAALGATISVPAIAADDAVARGPVPSWVVPSELMPVPADAAGLVFVRNQDVLIHLDEDGQSNYLAYRIKILHANALSLGNVSITWNPSAGAPTVHSLKIYRGESVIDVLKGSTFEVLRREGQLEMAMLDGLLTAVLKVPDLRVGDEIELAVTTRAKDPTLGVDSYGLLTLAPEPAPGRFHLGLSWDQHQEPQLKLTPDLQPLVQRTERAISFALDNPALLTPPKDAPPRFLWQRVAEFSDFRDWQTVSRRFAPLYAAASALKPDSPLKREAAQIAAASKGQLAQASAALKLVQQEVRYIYVGLDAGNFTPATADETWQRRYGDCKGKTALLLALLNELGIKAEAVLANNGGFDDGLDERLPSPAMFDHVLVRAELDGKVYWLDGTMPPVATPSFEPIMPYRWVLPLSAGGMTIERQPWQPDERPTEIAMFDIDATAGFEQPAKVVSTTILRGIGGLQQQAQFSGLTRAQMTNGFRQQMVGDTWDSIDDVEWRYDVAGRASVLKVTGTWTVDWDDDGGGARSMSLPGGGFSPPERRLRAAGQDQAPFYRQPEFDCRVTTVRLPEATPADRWSFNTEFDTELFGTRYHRAFEKRDGTIRMIRGLRVNRPEIPAETASKDNARIAGFDNSMAWIYYRPQSLRKNEADSGTPVPATDEIDWTADDVPCLG